MSSKRDTMVHLILENTGRVFVQNEKNARQSLRYAEESRVLYASGERKRMHRFHRDGLRVMTEAEIEAWERAKKPMIFSAQAAAASSIVSAQQREIEMLRAQLAEKNGGPRIAELEEEIAAVEGADEVPGEENPLKAMKGAKK